MAYAPGWAVSVYPVNKGSVYFMTPDLTGVPSGGVQVIYRMAKLLGDLGVPAAVWHGVVPAGHETLEIDAKVVEGTHRTLLPGDVLVMIEVGGPRWSFIPADFPVVILNQGHNFTFQNTGFQTELPGGYPGWPTAVAAISTSRLIQRFLEMATPGDFPVHRIPVVVDPFFRPKPKRQVVALMSRRRAGDLTSVLQLLQRSGKLKGWEVRIIDGMSRRQVSEALSDVAIFLSGADHDGFGLPQAEAIAAGCYLVGFTGGGGQEFMSPEWCSPILSEDVVAFAEATAEAMREFEQDPDGQASRVQEGISYIRQEYSEQAMSDALIEVFGWLRADGSPALIDRETEVRHYSAFRPKKWLSLYAKARSVTARAMRKAVR